MALSLALAARQTASKKLIANGFIFEIIYRRGESSVLHHVWVSLEAEQQLERNDFGERPVLKDSIADKLAGDLGENDILAGIEHVHLADFDFLVKLLGLELRLLGGTGGVGLFQGMFQKHLFQQVVVVEPFGIALQKGDGGERALLRVQFLGLREFQERRDIEGAGRINNDDALALLETLDEINSVNGRPEENKHGEAKPKPCQTVLLDEDA